jgi:hypothetical protein
MLVFMVTANLLCRNSIPWENIVYYVHTLEFTIVSLINIEKIKDRTTRFPLQPGGEFGCSLMQCFQIIVILY